MLDVAGSLTLGTVLILVLLVWRKASLASQDLPLAPDLLASPAESCPTEFVARIFSREDFHFTLATHSKPLQDFFQRERKAVALLWVRQTSGCIRQILREHTALARHSENLHFQTEVEIILRYLQLRALCGFLFVAIALAGPIWVRGLALRAEGLLQRFEQARESVRSVSGVGQLRGSGSI